MFQPIDWSRFHKDLPITFLLTVICIGLYLDYNAAVWLNQPSGFIAPQISYPGVLNPAAWLAHLFHASLLHLVSNLLIIIFMGMLLERHLGWWRYLVLILLVWQLTVMGLYFFNTNPVLGFSGIGMGLMVLAYFYWQDDAYASQMLFVLIVINLLFGLMPGVSWHGHLIGALSGAAVYAIIRAAQIGQAK